jgi:hypothetical protein
MLILIMLNVIMPNVIKLNVIMLNVIMLNAIMLSVAAPVSEPLMTTKKSFIILVLGGKSDGLKKSC